LISRKYGTPASLIRKSMRPRSRQSVSQNTVCAVRRSSSAMAGGMAAGAFTLTALSSEVFSA
jgi:hypothetical protein